ncbi:MAG: hypothetical protein HFI38_06395 [Lachnospiraceae bacterium]|nr:hypothetical protein [Lachnospiraceae bacterium]
MKKRIVMTDLAIFAMMILLVSCQNADLNKCLDSNKTSNEIKHLADPQFDTDEYLERYDHDNGWARSGNVACITNNTLYFMPPIYGNYILYADLASGISGPLCGKPECFHMDESCSAYVYGYAEGMTSYDNHLYWGERRIFQPVEIYSMEYDGTNRQKVKELDYNLNQHVNVNYDMFFHRGYIYVGGGVSEVSEGQPYCGALVYTVSLNRDEEEIIILDKDFPAETEVRVQMLAWRNDIYIVLYTWKDSVDHLSLYRWDSKTRELHELYDEDISFWVFKAWVTDTGILFSSSGNSVIYQYDFAAEQLALLFDFNEKGSIGGTFFFAENQMIGWYLDENHIPAIQINDFEGNELFNSDLNAKEYIKFGEAVHFLGASDSAIYFYWIYSGGKRAVVKIPFDGGGEVQELWYGYSE